MCISPLGAVAAPATLLAMMLFRLVLFGLFSMAVAPREVALPSVRGVSMAYQCALTRTTMSGARCGSKIMLSGTPGGKAPGGGLAAAGV